MHSRVHWVGSVINPIDSLNKLEYHFNLLCGHCLLPQLASNWGGVGGKLSGWDSFSVGVCVGGNV